MPKSRTVEAPSELLAYLFESWPEAKKKQIRTWLKVGAVSVNRRPVTQFDHRLRRGDVVSVNTDRAAAERQAERQAALCELEIRFEDDDLLVIEKPPGLLSVATETEREITAYRQLTEYLKQGSPRSRERVWIVHRLDRETSGLMVFAKTAEAKRALQSNWETAVKRYLAVVEGRMPEAARGELESDLNESNPHKVFSARPSELTRHAVTRYEVVAIADERTLVELTLETGRRHQIRVHLADAGHPVVGDERYGAATDPAKRLALHATGLSFPHPRTGAPLAFDSPLPKALARLLGLRASLVWSRARG
jgi:23S rRNA pseudouridine1911/1915/1917 synthase